MPTKRNVAFSLDHKSMSLLEQLNEHLGLDNLSAAVRLVIHEAANSRNIQPRSEVFAWNGGTDYRSGKKVSDAPSLKKTA